MVRSQSLINDFQKDVSSNSIPQVSFIVAPTWLSEHATNHPQDGEALSSKLIQILGANTDLYAKTAFILNYDEGGQFFDHHWTPTPPRDSTDGISTVSVDGELTKTVEFNIPVGNPIGLGFRVPLVIVSPWTRGGYVYSEVADHTSTLKFLEKRFGIHCPNISPWRRAVTGDLTHAFNFDSPDYSWPELPATDSNWDKSKAQCNGNPPPVIPAVQTLPVQEVGTKKACALPYQFEFDANVLDGLLIISMINSGEGGAHFQLYNMLIPTIQPRK